MCQMAKQLLHWLNISQACIGLYKSSFWKKNMI